MPTKVQTCSKFQVKNNLFYSLLTEVYKYLPKFNFTCLPFGLTWNFCRGFSGLKNMSFSDINHIIQEIRETLAIQFQAADAWFDAPENLRGYRPPRGSWTIDEILEHITLTNHFLLILIRKGGQRSLELLGKSDFEAAAQHYFFHREKLEDVGMLGSFVWERPEHMEPIGAPPEEVRARLQEQLAECLAWLDQLGQGAGILYKTTMTVNELGKIDVYEYLYFLAMHTRRHLMQMEENKRLFEAAPDPADDVE